MKKLYCLLLACALCAAALCGCSGGGKTASDETRDDAGQAAPAAAQTPIPEEGDHGETDQSAALQDMPTLEPVERIDGNTDAYYSIDDLINGDDASGTAEAPAPEQQSEATVQPAATVDTSVYQYSALIDTSLGFTFNYPSHWKSVPGVFTVCFREPAEPDKFPARVAITAKKLVHTPEGNALTEELTSYMRAIYKMYDAKTFQMGTANSDDIFMGKQAISNTYLAYSGETEVKGFVLARPVGRVLYVFHFCCAYENYAAMESLMRYMANSVELVGEG